MKPTPDDPRALGRSIPALIPASFGAIGALPAPCPHGEADAMRRVPHFTSAELELFAAYIRRVAPLPAAELEKAIEISRPRLLRNKEFFLRAGDRATETGVVLQGLLREYFISSDGTERTKAFVRESQSTGSLADLLSGRPSRAFIVAEEPARLLTLDYEELRAMIARSPEWIGWSVRLLELAFAGKAEREYELLGLDAAERYAILSDRFPGLESRVAAKHIASYLGITPVYLSRLRRRRSGQRVSKAG